MTTVVLGDSIVRRTGDNYITSDAQLQGSGRTIWAGLSGARICNMAVRATRVARDHGYPSTIVVALGSNDIFAKDTPIGLTRRRLIEELNALRNFFPHARIIWSNILPRKVYKRETNPGAGKKCTIDLNDNARKVLVKMPNAHIIKNSHIFNPHFNVFSDDVHLNEYGMGLFKQHLSRALVFFNSSPGDFQYPTRQALGY